MARREIITLRVNKELLERIDKVAKKLGISRAELIRTAVIAFIREVYGGGSTN